MALVAVEDADLLHAARPDLLLPSPGLLRRRDEPGVGVRGEVGAVVLEPRLPGALVAKVRLEEQEIAGRVPAPFTEQVAEGLAGVPAANRLQQPVAQCRREHNGVVEHACLTTVVSVARHGASSGGPGRRVENRSSNGRGAGAAATGRYLSLARR